MVIISSFVARIASCILCGIEAGWLALLSFLEFFGDFRIKDTMDII